MHIIGQSCDLHQIVILDLKGTIVHSSDVLFDFSSTPPETIFDLFPLLESIFPSLEGLSPHDDPLLFTKVETNIDELPGVYDFQFTSVDLNEQSYILWMIYDYTEVYEKYRAYQQKKNELEIHRQYFEQRISNLTTIESFKQLTTTNDDKG